MRRMVTSPPGMHSAVKRATLAMWWKPNNVHQGSSLSDRLFGYRQHPRHHRHRVASFSHDFALENAKPHPDAGGDGRCHRLHSQPPQWSVILMARGPRAVSAHWVCLPGSGARGPAVSRLDRAAPRQCGPSLMSWMSGIGTKRTRDAAVKTEHLAASYPRARKGARALVILSQQH